MWSPGEHEERHLAFEHRKAHLVRLTLEGMPTIDACRQVGMTPSAATSYLAHAGLRRILLPEAERLARLAHNPNSDRARRRQKFHFRRLMRAYHQAEGVACSREGCDEPAGFTGVCRFHRGRMPTTGV
jgi:hypothetical protein